MRNLGLGQLWRSVGRKPLRRNQHTDVSQYPFPVLRPVLWSVTAITTIYIGAASWELSAQIDEYKTVQRTHPGAYGPLSLELLEHIADQQADDELRTRIQWKKQFTSYQDLASASGLQQAWTALTGPEKAAWTAIGLNTTIFAWTRNLPRLTSGFYHLPLSGRNWTLLTSVFGHSGPLHLLFNMYVLNNFTLPVSRSDTFRGSGKHSVAFFLSSGIFASLAYHLQSAFKPAQRMIPALGASGAIYALLGVFGMSYPDAGVGIVFLPFSWPAQDTLMVLAAFETWGTVFGTGLGLAHAAHLGGLLAGVGYVYFKGGDRVWGRLKRSIYNMRYKRLEAEYS